MKNSFLEEHMPACRCGLCLRKQVKLDHTCIYISTVITRGCGCSRSCAIDYCPLFFLSVKHVGPTISVHGKKSAEPTHSV